MIKFVIGVIVGAVIVSYYPDVAPMIKYKFLETSGITRDPVVETLKEFK